MALLFQSNPNQWNLRKFFVPGDYAAWFVYRYKTLMDSGQLVLLWSAKGRTGSRAIKGLYGWGITTNSPQDYSGELRIPLKYIERWVSKNDYVNKVPIEKHIAPIPAKTVFQLPSWKNHLLAVMPIGTNFLVTKEQLNELLYRIVSVRFPTSQLRQAVNLSIEGKQLNPDNFKPNKVVATED
jgi:hypothetical protein